VLTIPEMHPYYIAEDRRPVEKCLADVAACDVYVGIFAWRYGWIPTENNPDQISITEMEYRQAVRTGKKCLIFLLDGKAPWLPDFIDDDKTRIKKLRNELSEKHGAGLFKSAEDIGSVVAPAVYNWAKERGYISPGPVIHEFDLEAYYTALRKRYQTLALEGLTPPQKEEYLQLQLRSVFVEQNVRESPPPVELPKEVWDKLERERAIHPEDLPASVTLEDIHRAREAYYQKPSRPVLDVLADSRYPQVIILGDPVSGKSTLARYVLLALIDPTGDGKLRRERILRSFKESASIRQLAGNPMLLTIMAVIGKHQELPRERWKLYDHAASVLIQHWDVNKHLRNQRIDADLIGEDDKKELLRRLAFKMQGGEGGLAGNYIHREQLEAEFGSYLKERYQYSPPDATRIARAMIDQFRERNFILSLYGANLYGFVHRAFLEYFCASAFVHKFEKTQEMTMEQLKRDAYGAHWEDESWHEVLRLICGMIDERWAGEIIDYLANEVYRPWPKTFRDRPPWNIALAVQCLGEIRNLNIVAEHAGRLLKMLCSLFDCIMTRNEFMLDAFLKEQVAVPAGLISPHWPYQAVLAEWLKERGAFEIAWNFVESFGEFVGSIGKGSGMVHMALLDCVAHNDRDYRVLAPCALARGWHDDLQTLPTLCALAVRDASEEVRSAAVLALAEHFRDAPQTSPLLRDHVVNDTSSLIRGYTVHSLAEHFRDDPQTLPFLHDRAVNDADWHVRRAAIFALAEHYRDNPQTLPLVRDHAVNDAHGWIRSAAVSALAEHFHDDPQTLPMVLDRAVNDAGEGVRSAAVRALAEHFRDDPQTLPLVRDRAINDTHEDVRSAAVRALAEHFRDDPQTLLLVRDCAVNDVSPTADAPNDKYYVREAAIDALSGYWSTHPDTLALLRERAENDPTEWLREHARKLVEQLSLGKQSDSHV